MRSIATSFINMLNDSTRNTLAQKQSGRANIYNNEETKKIFNREYFAMIKPYDEFSYLDESTELIEMDSKAHFDTVYQSNWFYYHKDH